MPIIKLSRHRLDMASHPIQRVSDLQADTVHANELHGTVYYSDIYFQDKKCPRCGKKFKKNDILVLGVTQVKPKNIAAVPVHLSCTVK